MDQHPDLNPDYMYTPKELAFLWNFDDETIRRIFRGEPGVMVYDNQARETGGRRKRTYSTLRIPGRVAIRVKSRMTVVSPM